MGGMMARPSVHEIQLELARAHVTGHERDAQRHRALRMDGGQLRRVNRVKGAEQVELAVVVRRGIAEDRHLNVHAKILTQRREETKPQSTGGSGWARFDTATMQHHGKRSADLRIGVNG